MGLFRRKSKRRKQQETPLRISSDKQGHGDVQFDSLSGSETSHATTPPSLAELQQPIQQPSLESLPGLISSLQAVARMANKSTSSANKAARILAKLFSLCEHDSFVDNRIHMAQTTSLVPLLQKLLGDSDSTKKQYFLTALLVLNNLCIPLENKRCMITTHKIVPTLCQWLVRDPSCHLIAIVLVNLSVCEYTLRMELVQPVPPTESDASPDNGCGLLESLSLALRVACLTAKDYQQYQELWKAVPFSQVSVKERLQKLLAADEDYCKALATQEALICDPEDDDEDDDDANDDENSILSGAVSNRTQQELDGSFRLLPLPAISEQAFPDTVRWLLTALKNLSRPCKDTSIVQTLVSLGIVPLLMSFVAVRASVGRVASAQTVSTTTTTTTTSTCCSDEAGLVEQTARQRASVVKRGNKHKSNARSLKDSIVTCRQSPGTWDSRSTQDAALTILMNLAAMPCNSEYFMGDVPAVQVLTAICNAQSHQNDLPAMLIFQRVKARMGLAYLIGSSGHFGQAPALPHVLGHDKSVLYLSSEDEAASLVSILTNTLHRRPDDGQPVYSGHTFSVKYVLLAIRCLLTQHENQIQLARSCGFALNAILVKVIALHALKNVLYVDAEAAEHAAFSLYLLSNHCFKRFKSCYPFLPNSFAHQPTTDAPMPDTCSVCDMRVVKVLTAYLQKQDNTPPGRHGVEQVLKRIKYLYFDGTASDLSNRRSLSTWHAADYELDPSLCELVDMMMVSEAVTPGARPDDNIFDRPLLRRCALRHGSETETLEWDNDDAVDMFESALQAAQELSFNSSKVRHLNAIDDVLIANNIVHSAMGEKTESYNFMWSWEDKALEIQRQLAGEDAIQIEASSCRATPEEHFLPSLGILDKLLGVLS